NAERQVNLRAKIDALGLRFGDDYAVVYEATMARFWFLREGVRTRVERVLSDVHEGRVLPDHELAEMRAYFPDRHFGELIFLVRGGVFTAPSDMSKRPGRAMHGYHPSEPHSYAALLTNQPSLPPNVTAIPHLHSLMMQELEAVTGRQASPARPAKARAAAR